MLEQDFNAESLPVLRETVLAYARDAGMPHSRAIEVMLVAHELASNADHQPCFRTALICAASSSRAARDGSCHLTSKWNRSSAVRGKTCTWRWKTV